MGKFTKGLFIGAGLGAGLMWLSVTKKGRALRDEMLDHASVVYSDIKDELLSSDAWRKMSKNEYVAVVKEFVDKYAIKNGLASELKELVATLLVTQWQNLKNQLPKEKKGKK
ncbi:MAG: hypothetical protein KBD73_01630 [Candidatus Magasanikbacteria bacterium]|nr:hypothetical protein [Candidatus Magasanikbacteria bacterium]